MNKPRRKEIQRAIDLLCEAEGILASAEGDEQEAYDNMPEGLQDSERGEKMSENIDVLIECQSELEDMVESLLEVIE